MLLDLLGPMVRPPAAPSISILVIFRFGATMELGRSERTSHGVDAANSLRRALSPTFMHRSRQHLYSITSSARAGHACERFRKAPDHHVRRYAKRAAGSDRSPGSCPSCIPRDAGLGHYGRDDVAAVARVLVSMLAIIRRAIAAGMTAFMIRLTRPGIMTGRQMRTCWQALYQAGPPPSSAQEKRARGRSRCGSAGLERFWSGF